MYDILNINSGFEAMLPEPKLPEVEEVPPKNEKEISVEFTFLNWRFKFGITFTRA
jgi:hypothetical protein